MTQSSINEADVDIVIGAMRSDLTSFLNAWKPFFSKHHIIIVKDPGLKDDLKVPEGFNLSTYAKADIDAVVGSSNAALFSGHACRHFGYLVSRKKYVLSINDDCFPATDSSGMIVDAVAQHIVNLTTPATPFFFNTLYDPYRKGTDFVRGYPFSLRTGVDCVLSCGLWLDIAPTQGEKPELRNSRYVDAVLTIPAKTMMPICGINIAFDRELIGPALMPCMKMAAAGTGRWEALDDIWNGMCIKTICDHLGAGVKSGLPYVARNNSGTTFESLSKDWEGTKLLEEAVPFFESLELPESATNAEECVLEIAAMVTDRLGLVNPLYAQTAECMLEWIKLWKEVGSK